MKHALRSLAKTPGFTAVAVMTLALGMGANTAFFSVLHGVVLRDPPYPHAARVYEVYNLVGEAVAKGGRLSSAELADYRARQQSFSELGAYVSGRITLNADHGAERVLLTRVTANVLPLLGVAPAQGRSFDASEEHTGADSVVIVSHEFWQNQLGGASDVLNSMIRLNGIAHTIVGVMPPGFSFGAEPDTSVWTPLSLDSRGASADRHDHWLVALGRLAPGVSAAQAQDDLRRVARQLRTELPTEYSTDPQWSIGLQSLRLSQFGAMRTPLGVLMTAATTVLLIACVNVSIMFLLRAVTRRREVMIRIALGAPRRHIVAQLLTESAVVCALGTLAGLAVAVLGLAALKAFPPADIPRLHEVTLNGPVAAFTAGVLVVVTLLVSLAPALATLRTRVTDTSIHTGRSSETRSAARWRDSLTIVEIALAMVLLVSAGLTLRSFQHLLAVDLGFAPAQVLSFKTNLAENAYPDAARANQFYDDLLHRIEMLPGVVAVGAVSYVPLSGESQYSTVTLASGQVGTDAITKSPDVGWRVVRGDYFETMGLSLLRGRFFDRTDQANSVFVTVVDDAFARRFWGNEDAALGQQVRFGPDPSANFCTVVGVVRHVKHFGPKQDTLPEAYVPHTQFYQRGMYTVVKTAQAQEDLVPQLRAALAAVDPAVPLYFVETMERRFDHAIALPRFTAGLVAAFSAVALVLAGVGIFGVTAYSVGQRTREFGIRFALGAQRSHVTGIVLRRAGMLTLIGGVVGWFAATSIAQWMASLLFGVEPADTPTLVVAAIVIGLTTLLACLSPLRRAHRIEPVEALRAE